MKMDVDKIDILKEIINIGVGRGADVLNTMVGLHVRLQVICLKTLRLSEYEDEMQSENECKLSCVQLPFMGDFTGIAGLVFPLDSAFRFTVALTKDRPNTADMDSIHAGALCEIGNIVLNTVMGTISNQFGFKFIYSVPSYREGDFGCLLPSHVSMPDVTVLFTRVNFSIEDIEVTGDIIVYFDISSFDKLLGAIDVYGEARES